MTGRRGDRDGNPSAVWDVMKSNRSLVSTLILLLDWLGAPPGFADQVQPVILTAEVTVVNRSDRDIEGYVHRLSVPVSGHLQQKLVDIRYEYPEGIKRKRHRHGDSDYVEFRWNIPARSSSTRNVRFDLELSPYDYTKRENATGQEANGSYLQPAKYIESDSGAIKRLAAQIERTYDTDEERLRAAFLLPQQMIDYQVQPTAGALSAIERGKGDCTEFAALFVALARAMGYPARMTTDFLFTSRKEFSQPNHHSAEVHLHGNWIPVDPNLALDPKFGYGFGVGGKDKVILTRDFSWVWSNSWPKSSSGETREVDVKVLWTVN